MDLIDRQALLKQIEIDSDGEPGYYGGTWKFIDTIKNLPSAQPKWMKAKWKPVEVDSDYNVWLWECENCHEETEFKWDFCPVCGCEMTNATKVNG